MEIEKMLNYNGKDERFVVRTLSYGEMQDLKDESSEVQMVDKIYTATVKEGKMGQLLVLKSLKVAPFEINITNVRALDLELGQALQMMAQEANGLVEIKKPESATESSN